MTATTPMAKAKKAYTEERRLRWVLFPQMLGGYAICTAAFGNGARIGSVIIRKMTWLIRREKMRECTVCIVVVLGGLILRVAARLIVAGLTLAAVTAASASVSVSSRNEFPCRQR